MVVSPFPSILNWLFPVPWLKQLSRFYRAFTPAIFLGGKFVAGSAGGTNPEAKAKERRSLGKGSCLWCLSYRSSVDLGMDDFFFLRSRRYLESRGIFLKWNGIKMVGRNKFAISWSMLLMLQKSSERTQLVRWHFHPTSYWNILKQGYHFFPDGVRFLNHQLLVMYQKETWVVLSLEV